MLKPTHNVKVIKAAEVTSTDNSPKKLIRAKSILEGKNAIGFQDLDFDVVREIRSANT